VRWQVYFIAIMLCGILIPACAVKAESESPVPVQITLQDSNYLITTPIYKARINDDGNLHSLSVNGVELLNDRIAGSAGSAFFVEHPLALPKVTLAGLTITASNDTYTIKYAFERNRISLTLRQSSAKRAAYVTFCSTSMAFLENISENTALPDMAAVPSNHDWTDVRISTAGGEFLQLQHGSRTWRSGLGCQVWELSNITPNKEYKLLFTPGVGVPRQPSLDQLTILSASVSSPDHLVTAGAATELEVRFENNSNQTITGGLNLRVVSSLQAPLLMDNQKPLICEPHKALHFNWTLTPTIPDFYTVYCSVNMKGATKSLMTTFGYDTKSIAPSIVKPDQFAKYWTNVVAEAQAVEPKLTRLVDPEDSTSTVTVYRVGMEADGQTCFGWLAVPKLPARYPGILFLPGEHIGNISPKKAPTILLASCGFVVLSIEPTGQAVEAEFKPLISKAYTHVDDTVNFGLRTIMVHYLRALSALTTIPEVDPHRLGVTGVSLGGALAMELAALDERIWAVAPDVPYFCHIELGKTQQEWPYPEIRDYLHRHPEQREAVLESLRYYDVANFAEQITCPVLISAGINDLYSRPTGIFGVYNRLAGAHDIKLYLADHIGGDRAHWAEKIRWFTKVLGGPGPQPAGTAVTEGENNGGAPTP